VNRCERCGADAAPGSKLCQECASPIEAESFERTRPIRLPGERVTGGATRPDVHVPDLRRSGGPALERIRASVAAADARLAASGGAADGRRVAGAPAREDDTFPTVIVRGEPLSGSYTVHGVRVRFVGRRDELRDLLAAAGKLAAEGRGRFGAVLGAAGAGKTRLLYELAARLGRVHDGPEMTLLRCRDEARPRPYEPVRRLVRAILQIEAGASSASALRALGTHAQRWGLPPPEASEATAQIARLLGLESREARDESGERTRPWKPGGGSAAEGGPGAPGAKPGAAHQWQSGNEKLHRALGALLAAEARRRPLLLVLEDAHAADPGTTAFAAAMARELRGAAAGLLVVGRALPPGFDASALDFTMTLGPLPDEEARLLLRAILARLPDPPEALLAMTLERAKGNPFAVEEVVRLLIETGAIHADAERWSVDAARLARAATELPKALDDLVRIRVASLSSEEREALRKAAVCGEVFPDGAIAMIELLEGRKLEDFDLFGDEERRRLDAVLGGLVRKDLLLARGVAPTGGADREYAFKHPVVRRQIYEGVDETRRRRYHYLVAQWLAARAGAGVDPEDVAVHFDEAAQPRDAARYYLRAADRARTAGAHERAITLYSRALDLLDHDDIAPRHRALRSLGEIHLMTGEHKESRRAFRATLRAAAALGDRAAGGAALRALGRLHLNVGEYDHAQQYLERAAELLAAAGDRDGLADALDLRASVALYRGSFRAVDEALEYYGRALESRRLAAAGGNPARVARSLIGIGELEMARGALRKAELGFEEAAELLRRSDAPGDLARALEGLAAVHAERGEHGRSVTLLAEALQLADQLADRRRRGSVLVGLGRGYLRLGRVGDAVAAMNEAAEIVEALGDRFGLGEARRGLASAYTALDEHRRAEELCEEALRAAEESGSKLSLGRSLRALGDALTSEVYTDHQGTDPRERRARADAHYRRAILIFEEMGHELELAKSYGAYGRFLHEHGDATKGRDYLARAKEIVGRAEEEPAGKRRFIPALTPAPTPPTGTKA